MALWLWVFMVLAFLVAIFGVLFLLAGLAHSRWWSQLWRIALGGGLLAGAVHLAVIGVMTQTGQVAL